jgi:hypothetical protein
MSKAENHFILCKLCTRPIEKRAELFFKRPDRMEKDEGYCLHCKEEAQQRLGVILIPVANAITIVPAELLLEFKNFRAECIQKMLRHQKEIRARAEIRTHENTESEAQPEYAPPSTIYVCECCGRSSKYRSKLLWMCSEAKERARLVYEHSIKRNEEGIVIQGLIVSKEDI